MEFLPILLRGKNMSPLLSICIPTRNRPAALQKTVNAVQDQIVAASALDMVEILISDNTDRDEMKIDASTFKDRNIRYTSNAGNIGYARNINKLIMEARGEYVWLLADDDIILESAVKSIVDCLKNQQKNKINYLTFYSGAGWNGTRDSNLYFKNCTKHYFISGREFLEKYWLSVIFVSVNIFHRERMIAHAEEKGIFENVNDVYQNFLLCINLIDTAGYVQVIPKTLLFGNYSTKLYTPYNSVSVPVLEYVKLLLQLRDLGIDKSIWQNIKKDVDASIISNGLRFVVRKIETDDDFDYSGEYAKVIKNGELPMMSRAKAGFIWLLFKYPRRISELIVRAMYMIRGKNHMYEIMRKENIDWYKEVQKDKIKISYG